MMMNLMCEYLIFIVPWMEEHEMTTVSLVLFQITINRSETNYLQRHVLTENHLIL